MISICEIDNPTKQINEMYRQRVCGVCFMHCSDQELFSTVADVPVCSCRGVGKYDVNFMKLRYRPTVGKTEIKLKHCSTVAHKLRSFTFLFHYLHFMRQFTPAPG